MINPFQRKDEGGRVTQSGPFCRSTVFAATSTHTMKFIPTEVQILAKEHYQLEVEATALQGYDEQNFLLRDKFGKKYILKIAGEEHGYHFLEAQIAIARHLANSNLASKFQHYIKNTKYRELTSIERNGKSYYLRVLSFLEGTFWVDQQEHSPDLLHKLGGFLGEMDATLKNFQHPALNRYYEWDLKNTLDARNNLRYIRSHEDRRLVDYFLLQFEMEVLPYISSLRSSAIHNDVNDYNILINGQYISGLIDFGDAVYSNTINNLAIACTYALLQQKEPIEAAAVLVKAYHEKHPLCEKELEVLYYLIAARLCISLTKSAFNASLNSDNHHHFLTEQAGWKLLHQWIKINPLRVQDAFHAACGYAPVIDHSNHYADILKKRKELIGKNLSISYKKHLKIIRGALQYLYDDKGNTFVDCVNNVSHVGHCHPTVVKAIQKQAAVLNTNTRYLNDNILEYAKRLLATFPSHLSVCYFTNSGSEANDLAIRMSRHYTNQKDVVVLDHAYHGTSTVAMELSPYKFDGKGGPGKMPYIHKAQNPDQYRGPFKANDREAGKKYAQDVKRIIDELAAQGKTPAAFICETILGVGGQIPLPDGYLKEVYGLIKAAGGLCIADEVQVGFGRVGSKFWGFELQEAMPDIVVLGKPIGNGHPLAAVITTAAIANSFNNGMEYFNTFGGNPVSMAAGLAVLDVIEDEELQKNALETGNHLLKGLSQLMVKHGIIGDVRGHGLFVGVELVRDRKTLKPAAPEIDTIVEKMKDRGFLISTDGPLHNVLKIKPPLVFSKENADELVKQLDIVLSEL